MTKITEINELGFKVTWRLLFLGYYGNEFFSIQFEGDGIIDYAIAQLINGNYNEVKYLKNL